PALSTLSLHDALPISVARTPRRELSCAAPRHRARSRRFDLLRRLRGRRLYHWRVPRYQRRRLDDVIDVVHQRGGVSQPASHLLMTGSYPTLPAREIGRAHV